MNRIFAAVFAAMLTCGTAFAADYPSYDREMSPYVAPGSIWHGGYFGANFGWATGKFEAEVAGLRGSLDADGAFGGVHVGYNIDSGSVVYGVEADVQLSGISGAVDFAGTGVAGELKWFSTLRGRIGLASGNFLFFGTGGLAIGEGKGSAYAPGLSGSKSKTHVGWTLGAGVELALNQDLSVRFEYLYADFGKKNYLSDVGIESRAGLTAHLFRVGATAHF